MVTVSEKNVSQRGLGSHRPHGTRAGLRTHKETLIYNEAVLQYSRFPYPKSSLFRKYRQDHKGRIHKSVMTIRIPYGI